jgi:hypothetical protein
MNKASGSARAEEAECVTSHQQSAGGAGVLGAWGPAQNHAVDIDIRARAYSAWFFSRRCPPGPAGHA